MNPNGYNGLWAVFAVTGIIYFILAIISGVQAI